MRRSVLGASPLEHYKCGPRLIPTKADIIATHPLLSMLNTDSDVYRGNSCIMSSMKKFFIGL